jgi:hypothetical protein
MNCVFNYILCMFSNPVNIFLFGLGLIILAVLSMLILVFKPLSLLMRDFETITSNKSLDRDTHLNQLMWSRTWTQLGLIALLGLCVVCGTIVVTWTQKAKQGDTIESQSQGGDKQDPKKLDKGSCASELQPQTVEIPNN